MNVPIGVNQPLVQDHPEAATSRDEIHCGQCGKYLNNQSRKHLLTGEVLDFLEQESSSSTRALLNTFKCICHVGANIKENVLKREMKTFQLKILNLFIKSIKTFCFIF